MRQPGVGASLDCSGFGRGPGWRGRSSRAASVAEGTPVRDDVAAGELRHRDAQSGAGSLSEQRTERGVSALEAGHSDVLRLLGPALFDTWYGHVSIF